MAKRCLPDDVRTRLDYEAKWIQPSLCVGYPIVNIRFFLRRRRPITLCRLLSRIIGRATRQHLSTAVDSRPGSRVPWIYTCEQQSSNCSSCWIHEGKIVDTRWAAAPHLERMICRPYSRPSGRLNSIGRARTSREERFTHTLLHDSLECCYRDCNRKHGVVCAIRTESLTTAKYSNPGTRR